MKVDRSKVTFNIVKPFTWCRYDIDENHLITTTAKCSESDEWNKDTGRRVAMKRMKEFCKRINPLIPIPMKPQVTVSHDACNVCTNCGGTGEYLDSGLPCTVCEGKGWLNIWKTKLES
jgi:hypothetical protein